MNFDIKNFNNQRKNLKNINNKKNIYSKTDIFITVIEHKSGAFSHALAVSQA